MVNEQRLRRWLREVRTGRRAISRVVQDLRQLPVENLRFARLDTHRRLRRGVPEAILCEGKTPTQLVRIVRRFMACRELALLTRLDPITYQTIQPRLPDLWYHSEARLGVWTPERRAKPRGLTVIASGGTADLPVAEEAAVTLEALGNRVARLYDVGVAGMHRILNAQRLLHRARVIVVVAGMEGALASVVAGLVRCPVIAVPTSVGYGASFGGLAPLLAMLNSCATGVAVVNIDNGFGAAYLAHLINCPPV